jgi:membrane associated rhomboid family serine protease
LLILPLHRPLSRENFPIATALLILINIFVFVFLQSGDERVAARAFSEYRNSSAARLEMPAYRDWMEQHGRGKDAAMLEALHDSADEMTFQLLQSDAEFQRELHADHIVTPQNAQYEQWKTQRQSLDALWAKRFTDRYDLRFSEFSPVRMFGAMFLHGSVGHLVGNMIFLAFLGLLVEGALGARNFLILYLLGGLGGQLVSLAWRWGTVGTALGASGAIASLMGMYCVLWGTRRVRFFWWFFVIFDYVKAPALILLPFWLGWEVLNLLFNAGANVGFDAHAGGILSGALLALGVRKLGWERHDFLDVEVKEDQRNADAEALQRAMDHLGKLDLAKAKPLLLELDARKPGQLPVLIALYRCARYGNEGEAVHARAAAALEVVPAGGPGMREQKALYDDYVKVGAGNPRLPSAVMLRLARDALKLGSEDSAEKILVTMTQQDPSQPGLAEAWFSLAQRAAPNDIQRRRLAYVAERFPEHAVAAKARFLLSQA